MSILSPARVRLLLCSLLALLVTFVSVGVAPAGSAAPAPLRAGAGYRLSGGDFVGYYVTRSGVKVYCIDPARRAPSAVSLTSIGRYSGMSRRTADELAFALSTWGDAATRAQAAAESQLVNTIVGHADEVRRRARALPRSVARVVAAHLRTVRALRGPYTLTVRAASAAAPGQASTGTVTVTTASGRGLPGTPVTVRGSGNVVLPATVRTGPGGTVAFRFTVTGTGPVSIAAAADRLAASGFTGTHPAAGQQRMVTWGRPGRATAQTGFQARLGALAHSYACSTTCNGRPRTTVRACAVPSAYPARLILQLGSSTQPIDFPAAARATCRSVDVVLTDRDQVAAGWTFFGPRGWTAPVAAGGAFVVDCPPVPAVQVDLTYDCEQGALTATVIAPATHPAALLVGGPVSRRVVAAPGSTARFATAVRCGTVQSYTLQAGVQRTNGGWNYGPAARVSTPAAPTLPRQP